MVASSLKSCYKLSNWRAYNKSLVSRGDITVRFHEDVIDQWEHDSLEVRAGHPFVYSDLAIETLLMLGELFRLPYRQTVGFRRALLKLMDVDVAFAHHTSLQKRATNLGITIEVARPEGSIDLVVDSTGLKVYGEGEWKVKKHGADGRRTWRKLHLAVDQDTHMIAAQSLTENLVHDGDQDGPLLEQVESDDKMFYCDGAYDQWKVHDSLAEQEIEAVIPPRKNAKTSSMATPVKSLYPATKRFATFACWGEKGGSRTSVIIAAAWQKPPCSARKTRLVGNSKIDHYQTRSPKQR